MNLSEAWYGPRWRLAWLWPLHAVMRVVIGLRRQLFRLGLLKSLHPGVPVIVVGNITVGGTGKTPLVLWLVDYLRQAGWQPGIVSRGYGGRAEHYPCRVQPYSHAAEVGDEPLLLARLSQVPVVVDPNRPRAAAALVALGCDIVISDDGLQHYRLQRDIEIVVIDAVRQLGNGWLLPAGPLRELPSRLQHVPFCVGNGAAVPGLAEFEMRLHATHCMSIGEQGTSQPLAQFAGKIVHAVAGIGNPRRFFTLLRAVGMQVIEHPFADHHAYTADDLPWRDAPILMTEKDAVKCRDFALANAWSVPVTAALDTHFVNKLASKLHRLGVGVKHG